MDLQRLRLGSGGSTARDEAPRPGPRRRAHQHRFIKGPIDLIWIASAARLPGRAVHVALAVAYLRGLNGRPEVRVTRQVSAQFGVDRHALRRALFALERAGLVRVARKAGSSPVVSIVERQPGQENHDAIP